MPFYVCTERIDIDSAVIQRPGWVPRGCDQPGASWIWLDGGLSLVYLPIDVVHSALEKFSEQAKEDLSADTARRMATKLGVGDPSKSRFDQIVGEMMRSPAQRWGVLRPSKMRQRYEIWLGPKDDRLLYAEPAAARRSSKSYEDTFNRTDGNLSGSTSSDGLFTWTEPQGTDWEVLTNQAQCVDLGDGAFVVALAGADTDTDDTFAELEISVISTTNTILIGPGTRFTTGGGSTPGYVFEAGFGSGSNFRRLYNFETDGDLGTPDGGDSNDVGTVLRVEADGSSISAIDDGVTIFGPITNTAHAGQTKAGMTAFAAGATTNDCAATVFRYADLVQAAAFSAVTGIRKPDFPLSF